MNFKILKCTYCSSSAIASEEKRHMGLVVSGMECRKEFERFWQLLKFIPAKTGGHLFLHIIYIKQNRQIAVALRNSKRNSWSYTQPAFTCSVSTTETSEQCVKSGQS